MIKAVNLTVHPFLLENCTPKDQALKPLEEAAEIFGAWQNPILGDLDIEIADCIQACVNLAVRNNIDLASAMEEVEKRNRKRGRYDE